MSKLYTVKQASKILGFSTNTVYKYINDGSLKASRASNNKGRFRITKRSLEEFVGGKLPTETPVVAEQLEPMASPVPEETIASGTQKPSLSLQASRVLLLGGLVLMIIEALTVSDISVTGQILRLVTLIIFFILVYQFVYPAKNWRRAEA